MNERCELPIPYPDELQYSVVTRYHLRSNNTSPKWTLKDVYGTENVIPTIDLPSHLDILSQRNIVKEITADHWINEHTFFPFYAPFLPKDRALQLRQLMKSSNGSGIHVLVGITASTIERSKELHFCHTCYEDDIKQYGEPYWHRTHQLPGVWICPIHHLILHQITYPISDRHGLTVLPISKSMFHSKAIAEGLSAKTFDRLLRMGMDIHFLMQMKEQPALYNCKHLLLPRLSEKGLVTAGLCIRQRNLEEQFVAFYGQGLLDMLESALKQNDHTWLASATRSMRYTVHPLRQMLLFGFLYGSFKEFLKQSILEYAPFGHGPWPCLNKAAEHFEKPVVTQCQITRCSDTGRPVGTFRCSCGFAYSRRGPDQTDTDKFHRGRIKSFGSIWLQKLQDCLKSGLSYRSTAGILGVDTNTVIKYAGKEIVAHEPSIKVSAAKKKPARSNKPKENVRARVNWEQRDLELSWRVEEACKEMLRDNGCKPTRIRIVTVGKRIDKLSLLEKHGDRLPVTMLILSNYLESVAQFQCRRVRWAAEQMNDKGPLNRWKLIKKAGLRPGFSSEVEDEINLCIGQNIVKYPFTTTEVTQWLH